MLVLISDYSHVSFFQQRTLYDNVSDCDLALNWRFVNRDDLIYPFDPYSSVKAFEGFEKEV